MKFDQDFIEKVRDANSVVDIISEYTVLKPAGDRHTGLCPFPDHNEKTPSFSVTDSKQLYYCFGCKKSGNIYTFLRELKGLSFPEAVEYLANRAGIALPEKVQGYVNDKEKDERNMMRRINQFALRTYEQKLKSLPESHPVKQYCQKRGITQEVIDTFRLGWAEDEWETLVQALKKQNVPLELADKLGLIRKRTKGKDGHYDIFRSRLMFPILTTSDHCVGFGGRIVGEGEPKYLNSPESPIFNKRMTLYGLPGAIKYIREKDKVVIVEGYMDLIALYSRGIRNVVATLGTAFTEGHARAIKRYTKNVVVMFDGDRAGLVAAERSLPIILAQGLHAKGCFLPEGSDPDDFVSSQGPEAMNQKIDSAQDLFLHRLNERMSGFRGGPAEKAAIVEEFAPLFEQTQDNVLKDLYVQELAERIAQQPNWVRSAIKNYTSKQPQRAAQAPSEPDLTQMERDSVLSNVEVETPKVILLENVPRVEQHFFSLCLSRKSFFEDLQTTRIHEQFLSQELRAVAERAIEVYGQMPSEFDRLTASLASEVKPVEVITQHLVKPLCDLNEADADKFFEDCKIKIRENYLRKQQKDLLAGLRSGGDKAAEKLEQIMNIQQDRNQLRSGKNPEKGTLE